MKKNSKTETHTHRLIVQGMHCSSCSNSIETYIREKIKTEKNATVSVNHLTRIAEITTIQPHETIKEWIRDTGFTPLEEIHTEHTKHSKSTIKTPWQETKPYLIKAAVNLLFGIPLMIITMLGVIPSPLMPIGQLIWVGIGVVTLVVMLWSVGPTYLRTLKRLRLRMFDMDTLMTISTVSAWIFAIIAISIPAFFAPILMHIDFASIFFILGMIFIGRSIKTYAEQSTRQKIQSLEQRLQVLQPKTATVKQGEQLLTLPVQQVLCDDIVEVQHGAHIPCDGMLVSEHANVDQQHITGEHKPVALKKGETLYAGSVNTGPVLTLRAQSGIHPETNQYHPSRLQSIHQQLCHANQTTHDTNLHKRAQKIAQYFVPCIILLAIAVGLLWLFLGPAPGVVYGFSVMMAILLCACPCALGLAAPASIAFCIFRSIEQGILFHEASAIEKTAEIDTFVFDKTGTLTETTGSVTDAFFYEPPTYLNSAIAAIEAQSLHPIGMAMRQHAVQHPSETQAELTHIRHDAQGRGLSATIEGASFVIGSIPFLTDEAHTTNAEQQQLIARLRAAGKTVLGVGFKGKIIALYAVDFPLKAHIETVIRQLKNDHKHVVLLTGDHKDTANRIAQKLNITEVHASQTPEQKQAFIQQLQKKKRVAMIGDGFNDVLALQAAHLGIAIGFTHGAAADITLQSPDALPKLLAISKKTKQNIHQNLIWTFFYNAFSIAIACGILFPIAGFMLNPILATVLMGTSSLFVILNASRLHYILKNPMLNHAPLWRRVWMHFKNASVLEKTYWVNLNLFALCTCVGAICMMSCGIPASTLFTSMTFAMGLAGCVCSMTFMTGVIGLAVLLTLGVIYVTARHFDLLPKFSGWMKQCQRKFKKDEIEKSTGVESATKRPDFHNRSHVGRESLRETHQNQERKDKGLEGLTYATTFTPTHNNSNDHNQNRHNGQKQSGECIDLGAQAQSYTRINDHRQRC